MLSLRLAAVEFSTALLIDGFRPFTGRRVKAGVWKGLF